MNSFEEIMQAIDYIEANIKKKLSIADMAKQVGFSQFHFIRLFTKTTGYSPYDYYRGRKITKTIEYMYQQNTKIIDAAYEFGFTSPDQFTRACIAVFGESPSTIRKLILENRFEGTTQITSEYLYFVTKQKVEKPKLVQMPTLLLSGMGFIQENNQDFMQIPKEILHFLETYIKKQQELYKINWTNQLKDAGYIRFVGVLGQEKTNSEQLLTKRIEQTAYLVIKINRQDQGNRYMRAYIDNFCLPEYQLERYLPYEIENLYLGESGKLLEEGYLYIPVIKRNE